MSQVTIIEVRTVCLVLTFYTGILELKPLITHHPSHANNVKIDSEMNKEFINRLCPHRGIGSENTLTGIKKALVTKPYMVEFDVQLKSHSLHLGHPPALNTKATLVQALGLFVKETAIPKIDLKINLQTQVDAVNELSAKLKTWNPRLCLINIDGDVTSESYMQAETRLLKNTSKSTLLNIDLNRYKQKTHAEIENHIKNLARTPFSISPNLDDNIDHAINFALKHSIGHIHFWSYFDKEYKLSYYYSLMQTVLESGLQVYFDIKFQNIADLEPQLI